MRFEFATATRIVFGAGSLREVAPAAREMGRRALLVIGCPEQCAAPLVAEMACPLFPVEGEPTLDLVRRGVQVAAAQHCDLVIGLGGGSAIDAGKAIAALAANGGDPLDYLEVIGKGQSLTRPSLPFIAVPTTAGAGAEVTRNAVLASPGHRVKASLRSPFMLPRLAVVDPDLALDLPPAITASTGLDALTQLIEPYVSIRANPVTDALCLEGMRRAAGALLRAFCEPHDREARTDMALASLFGGLALANAGLGAVHGFAAPLGGMFDAPHGAVCAALLPHAMAVNIRALRSRAPESEALTRYAAVARILTGRPDAAAEEAVEWAGRLCRELSIPPLGSYGISDQDLPVLIENAARASSMKANPVPLTPAELREILTGAM
ncbi:MAG: iron-containing alcohol dehydrogenase [Acidobacteriota bacterium]